VDVYALPGWIWGLVMRSWMLLAVADGLWPVGVAAWAEDDLCRATVNVVSTGDEEDLKMLTPLVERLLKRYGDKIEILHRAHVPEKRPQLRPLEIWWAGQTRTVEGLAPCSACLKASVVSCLGRFEGFETFQLYSRYQFLKKVRPAVVASGRAGQPLVGGGDSTADMGDWHGMAGEAREPDGEGDR
jgi:hypothetical protein